MACIYLIRHGQASFGEENYDALSELGMQQAELLGKALFGRIGQPDALYSGTMMRHQQTLKKALAGAGIDAPEYAQSSDWNEYDHQAVLAAFEPALKTAAGTRNWLEKSADPKIQFATVFAKAIQRWQSGEYHNYPESWHDFKQRVSHGLQSLIGELQHKQNAVVFTSGGPISAIVQHLFGLPDEKMMSVNWTLANCGITKIVKTPGRLFLASLNEHSHFEPADVQHMITYK